MEFLSVCSGIEAASVAWHPLGWRSVAYSEVDPFASAVLAHHFPDVPNRGDMTRFEEWPDATPDVLVGGTPCQSYSVAGLRAGLADPRGDLMLTYGAIARRYRPRWVCWENVPGVLSSNGGRDFAAFLWLLGQLGYGWAYRVLDAQYFGLAQRRRRVFVVGCLGNWAAAAAVLFDAAGMRGDPPPSRAAPKDLAGTLTRSALDGSSPTGGDGREGLMVVQPYGVANTLTHRMHKGINSTLDEGQTPVLAHTLRGSGFDASEDGSGRGTPLVPLIAPTLMAGQNRTGGHRSPGCDADSAAGLIPISFNCRQDPDHAIDVVGAIDAGRPQAQAVALRGRDGGATAELGGNLSNALRASQGGGDKAHVLTGMAVRKLTPRECERLQGFPDDWTRIPLRNKAGKLNGKWAKDGPRYKSLGNSMAVPVMGWIGARIQMVESLLGAL